MGKRINNFVLEKNNSTKIKVKYTIKMVPILLNHLDKVNVDLLEVVEELRILTSNLMVSSDFIDGANNIILLSKNCADALKEKLDLLLKDTYARILLVKESDASLKINLEDVQDMFKKSYERIAGLTPIAVSGDLALSSSDSTPSKDVPTEVPAEAPTNRNLLDPSTSTETKASLGIEPGITKEKFTCEDGKKIDYVLRMPEDATEDMDMVVWFHGYRDDGLSLDQIKVRGFIDAAERLGNQDCIIVQPKDDGVWNNARDADHLAEMVTSLSQQYNVDPSRITIAGHSNGAVGAWYYVNRHPETAGKVILASGYDGVKLDNPVWDTIPTLGFVGTVNDGANKRSMENGFQQLADRGNTNAQLYVVNTDHGGTGSKIIDESVFQWIKEN